MGEQATIVVDTNVLLHLATPVVDGRPRAPSGADPLKAVLTGYDVHVPTSVVGELADTQGGDDLLSNAATLVLSASQHLTTHDVETDLDEPVAVGLDTGESHGIRLANELPAAMFVTDEFNTTNYLLVSLALEDRNSLFTTPHLLCLFASRGVLDSHYVDAVLTYFLDTKQWDRQYVQALRRTYLTE
jgi:predicted ribonuclease YlaK